MKIVRGAPHALERQPSEDEVMPLRVAGHRRSPSSRPPRPAAALDGVISRAPRTRHADAPSRVPFGGSPADASYDGGDAIAVGGANQEVAPEGVAVLALRNRGRVALDNDMIQHGDLALEAQQPAQREVGVHGNGRRFRPRRPWRFEPLRSAPDRHSWTPARSASRRLGNSELDELPDNDRGFRTTLEPGWWARQPCRPQLRRTRRFRRRPASSTLEPQ